MTSDVPEPHDDPCGGAMEAGDNDLLETKGWCSRLRQENTNLQNALGKADTEIHDLSQEIALLRERNKSLRKETSQFLDLKEQVENLKFKVNQNKDAADMEDQLTKDKERCLQMEERAEQLLNQFDHSQDETMVLKKEVIWLRNLITDLEKNLHKKRQELEEKKELAQKRESIKMFMTANLNEYVSTIEVLNNKINTLQSQVEESPQEIAMRRTMDEASKLPAHHPVDGTLMYEIIKAKHEERLLWTEQQKKWDFLGLRLLSTMMLKVLWCNIKVAFFSGFFLLLFHYLHQLVQSEEPGFLGCYIRSIFSSETIELIEHILQPYLQLIDSGMLPT